MKTFHRVLFSSLLLCAAGAYAEDSIDTLLGQLRKESEKYCSGLKPDQRQRFGAEPMTVMAASLARIESDLRIGNYESVDQQIRQFSSYVPTPEVAGISSQIFIALQSAREKRDAEFVTKIDGLVEKTGHLCLAAKTEKELDELLGELANLRMSPNRGGSNNDMVQRASQKLESAARFTRRWQDYLAQLNAGNQNAARQIMQELASEGSGSYPILPRSELLARLGTASSAPNPPSAMETPLRAKSLAVEIKSLDDLSGALERIRQYYDGKPIPEETNSYLQVLSTISMAKDNLESGNIGMAMQIALGNSMYPVRPLPEKNTLLITKLRRELMMRVLPRYLDLPPDRALKADENSSDYLLRITKEASAAGDWLLVSHVLETYQHVAFVNSTAPEWLSRDRMTLELYLAGRNMERAGEYESALNSYLQALRAPGKYAPIEDIAERIKAMHKAIDDKRLAQQRAQQQQAEALRRQQQPAPPGR